MTALVYALAKSKREYERRALGGRGSRFASIENRMLFPDLLDIALCHLCGDRRFDVSFIMETRYDRSPLYCFTIRNFQSARVDVSSSAPIPENFSVTRTELMVDTALIAELMRQADEALLVFTLERAIEVLQRFDVQPRSRWLLPVGTTEQSDRARQREDLFFQEISERDYYLSSRFCQCPECKQRRQHQSND
jgi:hypothetical protein